MEGFKEGSLMEAQTAPMSLIRSFSTAEQFHCQSFVVKLQ